MSESIEQEGREALLLAAILFEQWIRFSWIEEDADGDFVINLPPESRAELIQDYPEFSGLVERLDGTIVDASMSCSAVLAFASDSIGTQALAILDDTEFQHRVGLFHQWLHEQVDTLSLKPYNFEQWKSMFGAWLAEHTEQTQH